MGGHLKYVTACGFKTIAFPPRKRLINRIIGIFRRDSDTSVPTTDPHAYQNKVGICTSETTRLPETVPVERIEFYLGTDEFGRCFLWLCCTSPRLR